MYLDISHFLPSTTLGLCFLGNVSIKVGCPFAMCITLEIHNMIYLYTISFLHFTVWSFGALPWILSMLSLCCVNFATLKKHTGKVLFWQIVVLLSSKLTANWRLIFTFAKLVSLSLKHTIDRKLTTLEKEKWKGLRLCVQFFCCYFSWSVVCIMTTNDGGAVLGVCGGEGGAFSLWLAVTAVLNQAP